MKSLLTIFAYTPDLKRKTTLNSLIQELQILRDFYDIMVVSHSSIGDLSNDLIDYLYIDNENLLLEDFNLTNKFWFNHDDFNITSGLVYPKSTHYAIYSLIHYTINFAKFKNYQKIHCIEYDISFDNVNLINNVDEKLNNYNNVMFKAYNDWTYGTYFAFTNQFPEEYYSHDKDFILKGIENVETRMTEYYTPKFLEINNRNTYYFKFADFEKMLFTQKIDSHNNNTLNWCIPVYKEITNTLELFVFNEKGGCWDIIVKCDDDYYTFKNETKSSWFLTSLGDFDSITNFQVIVNNELKHNLTFNNNNRNHFKNNNHVVWK